MENENPEGISDDLTTYQEAIAKAPLPKSKVGRSRKKPVTNTQEPLTFTMPQAEPDSKEGIVKQTLGKLGLNTTPSTDPPQAKLNRKQQELYDGISPIAMNVFITIATWGWSLAGPECSVLAPSDDVAAKIVQPLVRIYARMQKDGTPINPNYIDIAASLSALIGYAYTSTSLFIAYRRGELDIEQGPQTHEYEQPPIVAREARASRYSNGEAGITRRQQNPPNDETSGVHAGDSGSQPKQSLSIQQQYQRDALLRLTQIDFESRARRSGRVG